MKEREKSTEGERERKKFQRERERCESYFSFFEKKVREKEKSAEKMMCQRSQKCQFCPAEQAFLEM